MARRRIRRFGAWRPLGADIAPAPDVGFAPPLRVLEAGDADELRFGAPLPALVVVDVALAPAPAFVVVGTAFVVDVEDDVLARAFDDDEDDEEFGDDDMSIAAGEEPWFRPRVFSFQVSLPLSDLFDENSAERLQLVCDVELNSLMYRYI